MEGEDNLLESTRRGVTVEVVGTGMNPVVEGLLLMALRWPERPASPTISQAVEKLGVHKLRALRIVERSGRFPIDPKHSRWRTRITDGRY